MSNRPCIESEINLLMPNSFVIESPLLNYNCVIDLLDDNKNYIQMVFVIAKMNARSCMGSKVTGIRMTMCDSSVYVCNILVSLRYACYKICESILS